MGRKYLQYPIGRLRLLNIDTALQGAHHVSLAGDDIRQQRKLTIHLSILHIVDILIRDGQGDVQQDVGDVRTGKRLREMLHADPAD